MDLIFVLLDHINVFFLLILGYFIAVFFIKNRKFSSQKEWNYLFKRGWAEYILKKWRKSNQKADHPTIENENLRTLRYEDSCDTFSLWGTDAEGASLFIRFSRKTHNVADISLNLVLNDETSYQMLNHPRCMLESETSQVWSGGDLSLTPLDDFKRWRIIFNGLLFKNGSPDDANAQHVRLNFIWIAASEPTKLIHESSIKIMADSLAMQPWKNMTWMHPITQYSMEGYDQYGCLFGIVTMDDGKEPIPLNLPGIRQRRWGKSSSSRLKTSMTISGVGEDGVVFLIMMETLENQGMLLKFGNVRRPNGSLVSIDNVDMDFVNLNIIHEADLPKAFGIRFSASSSNFKVFVHLHTTNIIHVQEGIPWNWENTIVPFHCIINGVAGYGLLDSGKHYAGDCPFKAYSSPKHLKWCNLNGLTNDLCVSFKNEGAGNPKLVGGKGASLALLFSAQTEEFSVPDGFCLTVDTLVMQINEYKVLSDALEAILNVNKDYSEVALQDVCKKAENLFAETPVCNVVMESVLAHLQKLSKSNADDVSKNIYFAVRSSGIGEDSEELSAAGQNATILGCESFEDVLKGIQKCWASLFSFQSVAYRRQHGQEVQSGMGVVVQIVVEANAAGVMFTRHPNTGNPRNILITSNFGLGESVVSGQVEPDTIILNRDLQNNLSIHEISVGKKTHRVDLSKPNKSSEEKHGVQLVLLNDDESQTISLSEEHCLLLGKLAINQETLWGSARDIEWAVCKGKIFLLQARPITSLTNWTEFELSHEFDSPIMSKSDILTFGNAGEVLPGSMSPLSLSTVGKVIDDGVSAVSGCMPSPYYSKALGSTHYHMGLNLFYTMLMKVDKTITIDNKVMDMAIFGHSVINPRLHSIAVHRNGASTPFIKFKLVSQMIVNWWKSSGLMKAGTIRSDNLNFNVDESKTALQMYNAISDVYPLMLRSINDHNSTSSASVFTQLVFIQILINQQTDFTTENYADIAAILSSCQNVVSAEIPKYLQEISDAIFKSSMNQKFCEQKPEDAYRWLESNCPNIYEMIKKFLKNHGHRSIKEFDFMTETWGIDPTGLLESLQLSVGAMMNSKERRVPKPPPKTTHELIAQLKTRVAWLPRMILHSVIPMCQNSVTNREMTKAAVILMIHKTRLVYRMLAKKMMSEWKIPDENIIYFMSHSELGTYLKTRNPSYLIKAMQRRRFFDRWDALRFPEMNWGVPRPLNSADDLILRGSISKNKLIGTSVYAGCIVGRACVVPTISEIDQLKSGDILITHSTDVGWSPYFPILGGVITELGGLISHGAVVAREYGLPCIVGAQGATSIFKTGDIVLLNATEGFVGEFNETIPTETDPKSVDNLSSTLENKLEL